MMRILLISVLTTFLVSSALGQEWEDPTEETQKLTASDAEDGESFGFSVSLSGEVALVGAHEDEDNGSSSGSVYLYRYDPDVEEWVEEQKLTASDGEGGDLFGRSVSLSGEVALVGAYGVDDNGTSSGSAYVFRYDPDDEEWVEEQKLTPSDGEEREAFGLSVSLSGEVALVGAYFDDDDSGDHSGAAYVFDLSPPPVFLRGDIDGGGTVSALTDALYLLRYAFARGDAPPCMDAADVDDNDAVSALRDALYLLRYGFADGPEPPDPGVDECGADPTEDELGCVTQAEECE